MRQHTLTDIQQISCVMNGDIIYLHQVSIMWMLGVSVGWIFMNCAYIQFLIENEDEYQSESDMFIELEDGELLSVQSDWET